MNIRFAPESVRLRVSLQEAHALEREKRLTQRIPLIEGDIVIELKLVKQLNVPAKFSFLGQTAQTLLRDQEFFALLAEKPSRDSCINVVLNAAHEVPLEFSFEIDLFSREKKEGSD